MEKVIHFTVPARVTPIQTECIELARALHPTWEVRVWQDPVQSEGYPLEKYWPKVNSGAQLSDLIRLDTIYRWGGVYVDGDLRLLKPLDVLVENYDIFFASETGDSLEGAIFGARKAHPIIQSIIEDLLLNEPDWTLPPDKTTGPDIFTRIARWNADVTALPRETFYSYGPSETAARKNHRHSYGEHLWVYSWKELDRPLASRRRGLRSLAKGLLRPPITTGFRVWHRIKTFDRWASEKSIFLEKPRSWPANGDLIVKTVHGFNVVVDVNDAHSSKVIFGDPDELHYEVVVKGLLHGGDWVIDVGSNVASFCMLAAQSVGSFGRVFAYQKNPRSAAMLARSALINGMNDRVMVRPVTVGQISESAALARGPEQLNESQPADKNTNSTTSKFGWTDLDHEFPVDLPIKMLRINLGSDAVAILKGARRLLERRCIDFIAIEVLTETLGVRWRRELGGARFKELLTQLNWVIGCGYIACTISEYNSLTEHKGVTMALDSIGTGRNIILRADPETS